MIVSLCLRLLFNFYLINGDVLMQRIYDVIVANYTHAILGFWMFYTFLGIGRFLIKKEILKIIEKLSF